MRAIERILEIEEAFGEKIQGLVPLELDGESLRLILYLKDGTNLRVTEQWSEKTLKRYNYYWLTSANELKIGWDNAPHHTRLANFPDHKHVGGRENLEPSSETSFDRNVVGEATTRNNPGPATRGVDPAGSEQQAHGWYFVGAGGGHQEVF